MDFLLYLVLGKPQFYEYQTLQWNKIQIKQTRHCHKTTEQSERGSQKECQRHIS